MDITKLREMAGLKPIDTLHFDVLNEKVEIPDDASCEQIEHMLDAAKRGLGIANKLKDKEEQRKHRSQILGNLNKIRRALAKHCSPGADKE